MILFWIEWHQFEDRQDKDQRGQIVMKTKNEQIQ